MHRVKVKIAVMLADYNWETAIGYFLFLPWLLRRWGDKEFKRGRLKQALEFYELGASVSQEPRDYVRMLLCGLSARRANNIVKMVYYKCCYGKDNIL